MSVLLAEPDGFLDAMFQVIDRRHQAQKYGADAVEWQEGM